MTWIRLGSVLKTSPVFGLTLRMTEVVPAPAPGEAAALSPPELLPLGLEPLLPEPVEPLPSALEPLSPEPVEPLPPALDPLPPVLEPLPLPLELEPPPD